MMLQSLVNTSRNSYTRLFSTSKSISYLRTIYNKKAVAVMDEGNMTQYAELFGIVGKLHIVMDW